MERKAQSVRNGQFCKTRETHVISLCSKGTNNIGKSGQPTCNSGLQEPNRNIFFLPERTLEASVLFAEKIVLKPEEEAAQR